MNKLLVFLLLIVFLPGCKDNDFDINNPDVGTFVKQLKSGTYNLYEKGENGENLWLLMPNFNETHIKLLIEFSKDTTHVAYFPTNPLSSRTPIPQGRDYFILGECLLWTVEGIRNQSGHGSLDPYLIDTSLDDYEKYKGLTGDEILVVRELYVDWWSSYRNSDWKARNPLEGSSYKWF